MNARFRELFHSPEPLQRLMAAYALGELGVEQNIEELTQALEDEIPDVRKIAVEALGKGCSEACADVNRFVPRLSDENKDVRLAVVEVLGAARNPGVAQYLLQALDDKDDWVRIRALEALAQRREEKAVPRIIPLLDSPNKLIVLKVVEALGDIGGKTAFRALLEAVGSDDYEVQAAAEESLTRIKEEQGEDG